ncbi:hypothetical protein L208DRAFT_1402127 [Tricholoma matsutake]|nr:hypothetical protein L208DRAFT_1402127 [Tricholoma matsutake 945]
MPSNSSWYFQSFGRTKEQGTIIKSLSFTTQLQQSSSQSSILGNSVLYYYNALHFQARCCLRSPHPCVGKPHSRGTLVRSQLSRKSLDKTILGDVYEWTPINAVGGHITLVKTPASQAFNKSEFLVEFSGQPDGTYHFKLTADTAHALQLAGVPGGDLSFAPITWSGTSQLLGISCSTCSVSSPDVGLSCVISYTGIGTCVTGNIGGAMLSLASCDGTSSQRVQLPWIVG